MSNQYLKLRRSAVPGKIPTISSLDFGEIALNTYDGLAFMKKSGPGGEEIITLGGSTGSFAITGSNIFSGSQVITGSVDISGSLTVNTVNVGANTLNFIDNNRNILNSLSVSGNNILLATGSIETTNGSFFSGSFTGSLHGTSSWASNALAPIAVIGNTLYSTTPKSNPANNTPNPNENIFLGGTAGDLADNAIRTIFIGYGAGQEATNAQRSVFLGESAGGYAGSAAYSTLIGFNVGYNNNENPAIGGIGSNNIIIGSNITLPDNRKDSINIGGLIFGTGSYSNINYNNQSSGSAGGRIGINVVNPQHEFDVSGSIRLNDVLILPPQHPLPSGKPTGSLAVSGSEADCKIYFFNGSWNALF